MDRQTTLDLLARHKAHLSQNFGVMTLALFGSTVRGTATAASDVDVLVSFDGPATSARCFGVQFYLEDLLGCRVDVVTEKALRPELRFYVEREAVHV
jgi:predicted nucleotidyltransferase